MVYRPSAHEHDQEALLELTPKLSQISFGHDDEIKLATGFSSRRRQRLHQPLDLSELTESVTQISEAMDRFTDIYFGPDGALSEAIESATMASEFAQEIDNMGILDDLELCSTRLAATSAMTRNLTTSRLAATSIISSSLSDQLSQSPMFNLGATTKYLFENSNFHEALQATEEISGMVDDLAWMGAEASMFQGPTTPEPGYREAPFHEEAQETQNLLVTYLWAAISDSGEFASELSEEEKMRTRLCLSVLVGLVVGTLSGIGTSQFVHPILGVTSGLTAGISTGSAVATRLDNWYDMKRRQRLGDNE